LATVRSFAYNSGTGVTGTTQVGFIAAGDASQNYGSGLTWWNGPDEDLGYVICHTSGARTAGQGTINVPSPTIGFWRSGAKTDNSFLTLCNNLFGQNFADPSSAKTWLNANGYWTSYVTTPAVTPVLYLDAGNPASYPGSGTTWTDTIGGKVFYFPVTPAYSSADGGKLYFDGSNIAEGSPSLSSLSNWTVAVWHYSVGSLNTPVIWESYASSANVNYLLGNIYSGYGFVAGFNSGAVWRTTTTSYQLTANAWSYIVGTYDGATLKLYVNNVLINSANQTAASVSSGGSIQLMGNSEAGEYLEGYLATVGIYNTALTAGQISSIWNSTKSRFGL